MTDASPLRTGCPDFEVLSCYADGELGGGDAAAVAAHLGACPRCETLTGRLREGVAPGEGCRAGGAGGSGCIGEERLVAYAIGGLSGGERQAIAAHVGGCDACVGSLLQLHRRLGASSDAGGPRPGCRRTARPGGASAALAELASEQAAPARAPRATVYRATPGLRRRLARWLHVPTLAPVALAAMALFALAIGLRPSGAPSDVERTRALLAGGGDAARHGRSDHPLQPPERPLGGHRLGGARHGGRGCR
ncbi:MAG: zf-HC2 domain-containing protein [Candidatus Binatia bacterium]